MHNQKSIVPLLQDYDRVVDYIQSEVRLRPEESEHKAFAEKKYNGLWDTGSTKSCIRKDIVNELGLKPAGKSVIATANGNASVYTYDVSIELPNGSVISDLVMSSANLSGDVDVLIGMDVIREGDFHIDNRSGRTEFSFLL